jgi:hypothetical protein
LESHAFSALRMVGIAAGSGCGTGLDLHYARSDIEAMAGARFGGAVEACHHV